MAHSDCTQTCDFHILLSECQKCQNVPCIFVKIPLSWVCNVPRWDHTGYIMEGEKFARAAVTVG